MPAPRVGPIQTLFNAHSAPTLFPGAISTFLGITRDTFDGKRVVELEYEAYGPMALAKLLVCPSARHCLTALFCSLTF